MGSSGGGGAAKGTLDELMARLGAAAEEVVPWFLAQMPDSYFEDIDAASRLEHMAAICALRAAGQEPRLRMKSGDGRHITYVSPDAPGTLTTLMRDFREGTVRGAKLYSSKDRALIVDRFDVGDSPPCDLQAPASRDKYLATARLAESAAGTIIGTPSVTFAFMGPELEQHFAGLTEEYVKSCTPFRILTHAHLCRQVRQSGASAVMLENGDPERSRIVLACADVSSSNLLLRVANRLSTLGIDIVRAYVDTMTEAGEPVVIISAVVLVPGGGKIDPASDLWHHLRHDLLRLEWLDAETLELGYRVPALELGGADVLMTYADLAHRLLVKSNRYLYSRAHIAASLEQHLPLGEKLVALFLARFDPRQPLSDQEYQQRADALGGEVTAKVEDDVAGTVLSTMLEAIGATLRTNYYVDGRYALCLRLDPALIKDAAPRQEIPHGLFWVHGRGFNGFHLRFRDTARGGVRVVRPPSVEDHSRECERHLDEVYELAYAQQLKNKDIPEGGAKAVILVHPAREVTPCVRAFVDGILDLITTDPATRGQVVDRLGVEESIYFGPDENITPAHIDWIVGRARERRHPNPGALMSSKPGAGINHKEFGVTSEGVNVFLEVALVQALGIDPRRQPFTLKLTGGPDGDVGGNEIKIAVREFGELVKIVGVADGLGCAEDPRGLDHTELLRLVAESRSIAFFDPRRLSSEGRVTTLSHPDGARLRNEMHNRVVSDVFVPAGGRPQTINDSNWARFIGESGRPASRLIVEGANLFITQEARQHLFEHGVVIIKDSSANKCGVICSSYEVIACLLLEEAEFLAIKPAFVAQVLDRLRLVARREADLLFEAHRHRPTVPHFKLSILLSQEINRLGAALATSYPELERAQPELVRDTVLAYLPPVLVDKAGERVFSRLPPSYRAQLVCTSIAADLVYSEGLDYFRDVPEAPLTDLCLAYVLRQRATADLVREVEASALPRAREIAELLRVGGTRAALKSGKSA
jgi:glutamate dehydrogenase